MEKLLCCGVECFCLVVFRLLSCVCFVLFVSGFKCKKAVSINSIFLKQGLLSLSFCTALTNTMCKMCRLMLASLFFLPLYSV